MLNLCPCQPHQAAVSTNFSEPLHWLRQTCTSNPPTQVRTSWPQSSRRASPKEVNDEPKREKQRDRKKEPRSPGGRRLWCWHCDVAVMLRDITTNTCPRARARIKLVLTLTMLIQQRCMHAARRMRSDSPTVETFTCSTLCRSRCDGTNPQEAFRRGWYIIYHVFPSITD